MFGWLFGAKALPAAQPADPDPACKHLNARCHGTTLFGHAECPDCRGLVRVDVVLNNWFKELHSVRADLLRTIVNAPY